MKLTVDHVIPVALGGSDDPSNLVAACSDCNAGKSSTTPDAAFVAQVDSDALRWADAMRLAGERAGAARDSEKASCTHFKEHVWDGWTWGSPGKERKFDLPSDWTSAIVRQLHAGLTMKDLEHAVEVTMRNMRVVPGSEFRYFMGVCRTLLNDRAESARAILDNGEA